METCKTCKHWNLIDTTNVEAGGRMTESALSHAAQESFASNQPRGLCLKIPTSFSMSSFSNSFDYAVQLYDADFGVNIFDYKELVITETPKAYISCFATDLECQNSTSFITGENFGCICHESS